MIGVMDLVRKLRSPESKLVLEAVEELRARGWLEDGSLRGVVLCHAHLEMANLSNVKLTRANLQGANFSAANLRGADLFKAKLRDARNLGLEHLAQAKRLCFATMPDGAPYDGRFNLPGDLDLARWGKVDVTDPAAMAYFLGVSLEIYLHGQGREVLAK